MNKKLSPATASLDWLSSSLDDSRLGNSAQSANRRSRRSNKILEDKGNTAAILFENGSPGAKIAETGKNVSWKKIRRRFKQADYLAVEQLDGKKFKAIFLDGREVLLVTFNAKGIFRKARLISEDEYSRIEEFFEVDLNLPEIPNNESLILQDEVPGNLSIDSNQPRNSLAIPVGPSDGTQIGSGGSTPIVSPSPSDEVDPEPVQPQPVEIVTQVPPSQNVARFGTPEELVTTTEIDPTRNATLNDPARNSPTQFLTGLRGLAQGDPAITAIARSGAVAADPNAVAQTYIVSGIRNLIGGRQSSENTDATGAPLASAQDLVNSQGMLSEHWAASGGTFIRLTNAHWGGEVGQPTGFTGQFGVDTAGRLVEPLDQSLINARTLSNLAGVQAGSLPNTIPGEEPASWNVYHMSKGQYFDHGLTFMARSGASQSIASATANNDPLTLLSGGSVGVVGDRAAQFVRRAGTQDLVQVAWFDQPGSDRSAGLYELSIVDGQPIAGASAASIAGKPIENNDLLYKNLTEALVQNNQLYGSTDATRYLLQQSARFNTLINGVPAYQDAAGITYIAGQSAENQEWLVASGGDGDLVKLIPNSAVLTPERLAELEATLKGGFKLVKTADMLVSRIVNGDGLPGMPTYGELLINNGVETDRVQAVLTGENGQGSAIGSAPWVHLANDPRFVDPGNVYDYSDTNAGFTDLPLIGDIALAVTATSLSDPSQKGRLMAIDQNLDGIPDITGNEQPAVLGDAWGAGLLLSHVAGGDWRANENLGLTTIHTMWAREHNRWVKVLQALNAENGITGVTENEYFEMARIMVEAEYQKFIYEEFAPALAGEIPVNFANFPDPASPPDHGWDGYDPTVDPSISLEFAVASFRVGHSQINEFLLPGVTMLDGFLNPKLQAALGNTAIQAGLIGVAHEAIDTMLTDTVRNNLVTRNLDLSTANTLRGREVGLAKMNAMRQQLSGFDSNGNFQYEPVAGADGIEGTADDGTGMAPQEFMPLNINNGTDITRGILGPDRLYGTADDIPQNSNGFVGNIQLKPFANWGEYGLALHGGDGSGVMTPAQQQLLLKMVAAYSPDVTGITAEERLLSAEQLMGTTNINAYSNGLSDVDAWVGMLAEAPALDGSTGQMGPLMASVFWEQMDRLQEGDPKYYIDRVASLGHRLWNNLSPLSDILARTSLPGLMAQMPEINTPTTTAEFPAVFITQGSLDGLNLVDQVTNPGGTGAAAATDPNNLVLDQIAVPATPQYEFIGQQLRNIAFLYTGGEASDPWQGQYASNEGANFDDLNQAVSPSTGLGMTFSGQIFQTPQQASSIVIPAITDPLAV